MDEKQLQLLFDKYGKQQGFNDISEFKSLIADDNARKIFFEHNNAEMGFTDQKEFDNLLALKKKEPEPAKPLVQDSGKPAKNSSQSPLPFTSTTTTIPGTQPWPGTESKKDFEKRANNPALGIPEKGGKTKTHKMASAEVDGKYIAYPTIVNRGPGLQELSDDEAFKYAMETGEYKEFKTDAEAKAYAKGEYKKGTKLAEPELTPGKVKTLQDFNEVYGTVYNEPEFQGKEATPDQKAQQILNMVADNVARVNDVPELKKVIADKTSRELGYIESAKIPEEIQSQEAQKEFDNWINSEKGAAILGQIKRPLEEKAQQAVNMLQEGVKTGKITKEEAQKSLAQINQEINSQINDGINKEWDKEFEANVKGNLEKKFGEIQSERYKQAVAKDMLLSRRALYTIKSIANSENFKEMNFPDKKRVIAASWDATRVALEKRGYDRNFIEKYKEQYMSEFVYAASRTPKGDVTSYGVRDWAKDALKDVEEAKNEVKEKLNAKEAARQVNLGVGERAGELMMSGGLSGLMEGEDPLKQDPLKQDYSVLQQAEAQILSTLARPELGGGSFGGGLIQGFKFGQNYPVPYVKSAIELSNNLNIHRINQKVKEGKELNEGEKLLLHSLGMDNAYQQDAKPSFAYHVGEAATVSLPYMADMAAGNWAAAPARAATKAAILKLAPKMAGSMTFKYGVAQPIAVIVGEMSRTAADPIKWASGFFSHMNPEVQFAFGSDVDVKKIKDNGGDVVPIEDMVAILDRSTRDMIGQKTGKGMDPMEAFAYAFLDNFKENLSEQLGGALGGELGEQIIKTLAKNNEWAKRLIISSMLRKNGGLTPTSFQKTIKELKDATAFNGLLGENFEEYAAAVAEDFMYDRPVGMSITEDFAKETLAVTAALQVPMQALGLGAKYIAGADKTYKLNYRKQDGEMSEVEIPMEVAMSALGPKGKIYGAAWLYKELGKTNLTPEQRLAVFQNVQSKMYWDEVKVQSNKLFSSKFEALNEEKQNEVKAKAYEVVKPFLQTKDEMLLNALKRNKKEDNDISDKPKDEEGPTVDNENRPPQPPAPGSPQGPEQPPSGQPPVAPPITRDDDELPVEDDEDPEQILNDIAGKIQQKLDLTPEELAIFNQNEQWFKDVFDGQDVDLPIQKPVGPASLSGLGQDMDEDYQAAMNQYRDAFLEDIGITLDEFNQMNSSDKAKVEASYQKYLQDIQDIGEEEYSKPAKKKKKTPFTPSNEEEYLATELEGVRLKMGQLYTMFGKSFFDTGKKGKPYAINWGTRKDNGMELDTIAKSLSENEKSIFYGRDQQAIAQLIGDFIVANPGGAASYINQKIKQREIEGGVDRDQLENPNLINQIDDMVSQFSDEEIEEMELWLGDKDNLDSVEQAIDEWLGGDPFSDFGEFVNYFMGKFDIEDIAVKQPALAKKVKQLIDETRRKKQAQGGSDSKGKGSDEVEADGDGKGEEEKPEVETNEVPALEDVESTAKSKRGEALERIGVDRQGFDGLQRKEWEEARDYDLGRAVNIAKQQLKANPNSTIGSIPMNAANAIRAELEILGVKTNDKTLLSEIDSNLDELIGKTEPQVEAKDQKPEVNKQEDLGVDLDDFDMGDLDALMEADLFGNDNSPKGKSDFRKDYEKLLAAAKKELKDAETEVSKTRAEAKSRGIEGNTLEQVLRPKLSRYQMALKQLDIVRGQAGNVQKGEESQQTLFEGDLSTFLKKDLTPEQLQTGKKFITQFFDKGVYDFPKIAAIIKAKAGDQSLYGALPALVKVYMGEVASVDDDIADKMSSRAEVRTYVENFIIGFKEENTVKPLPDNVKIHDAVRVMREIAAKRPDLKPMFDEGEIVFNKMMDIREKAGNPEDMFVGVGAKPALPFPYRLETSLFSGKRATDEKRAQDIADFQREIDEGKEYLKNPPSDEELAAMKIENDAKKKAKEDKIAQDTADADKKKAAIDAKYQEEKEFIDELNPNRRGVFDTEIERMLLDGISKETIRKIKDVADAFNSIGEKMSLTEANKLLSRFKYRVTNYIQALRTAEGDLFAIPARESFIPILQSIADKYNEQSDNGKGGQNIPSTNQGGSENDGNDSGANQPDGGEGVGGGQRQGSGSSGSRGSGTDSGAGSNSGTPSSGTRGQGNNTSTGNATGRDGGNIDGKPNIDRNADGRSGSDDKLPIHQGRDLSFDQKRQKQLEAEPIEVKFGDEANIAETIPVALNSQKEDVMKAENALFGENNKKAVLFTNGTGTGKTSTALGIVKRFVKEGRQGENPKERRVLILTPKQSINNKFVNEGSWFNLPVHNLADTKDVGDGFNVVVTTHANFRENEEIQNQDWDMIIVDEADQLMQSQSGKQTRAVDALRIAGKHHSTTKRIAESRIGSPELQRLNEEIELSDQAIQDMVNSRQMDFSALTSMRNRLNDLKELRDTERKKYDELIKKEAARLEQQTKVVFMSATPFASVPALDYAEGFLYQYPKDKNGQRSHSAFMAQNFGWQYNDWGKLKNKSAGPEVDNGYLERQFHEKLKAEGVLFTRQLDSEFDYSRNFVLFTEPEGEQGIGRMIDEGISILRGDEFKMYRLVETKFNFLYTMRLLEAYKAKQIIPLVARLLKDGKKIVIFHNYNQGLPSHPFDFTEEDYIKAAGNGENARAVIAQMKNKVALFNEKYPKFRAMDMKGLINPIETITAAFGPQVLQFNGTVSKKNRQNGLVQFNEGTDKNIIVVQKEAGKAGIDLHDQLGNAQRVEINLGLPIMSNDAIQPEGRIFRVGNLSDAVFLYPVIHANFERFIWSDKSAPRSGTAENFALGDEARGLEVSFRDGYVNAVTIDEFNTKLDNNDYGKGGKEADKQLNSISPFDLARQHYALRQKRSRNKEPEGVDYYPTPEPLGFKMVEWSDIKPGQDVLEPSAGAGSISRYIPEYTNTDIIEPSDNLRSQAAMFGHKNTNHFGDRFEELAIGNKYDRIVMNPPFGFAGKTAMDHLAKAFQHLKDGGRVVALVPQGKMDDRLREFLYGENAPEDAVLRAVIKLPSVTFEKAGTNVNTQIIIIDRIKDKDLRSTVQSLGGSNMGSPNTMLQSIPTIKEFFENIEDMGVPLSVDVNAQQGQKPTSPSGVAPGSVEVVKNYHAKEQRDNWVAKIIGRAGTDRYNELKEKAKELGGNWSSYNKLGAIPGFQFKTEDAANKFANWANGGPQLQAETGDVKLTADEVEFRDNLTQALTDSFEGVVNNVVIAPSQDWGIPMSGVDYSVSNAFTQKYEGKTFANEINTRNRLIADIKKEFGYDNKVQYYLGVNEIGELVVKAKPQMQVEVFHGSPYKFDRFTTEKIGTGEGAQAFGWGLYFTDLESVAKDYARQIQVQGVLNKNIPIFADVAIKEEMSLDKDLLIKNLTSKLNDGIHNSVTVQKAIDFLVASTQNELDKLLVGNKNRNLYKASLHKGKSPIASDKYQVLGNLIVPKKNPNMSNEEYSDKARKGEIKPLMKFDTKEEAEQWLKNEDAKAEYTWLEWDKPIPKSQEEKIYDHFNNQDKYPFLDFNNITGKTGKEVYNELSISVGGDKNASLFLLEAGIDGIKYPAESIARGATSAKPRGFNYVVFDENAVSINEVIQFQKPSTGEVMGAFWGDNVYMDPRVARPETPIHEFFHAFDKLLSQYRPDILERGLELVADSEYYNEVKANPAYANLSDRDVRREALARAVAAKGVAMAENQKKGFSEWLKDFWKAIKDLVGIDKVSAKELSEMNLDQYSQAVIRTMFDKAAIANIKNDQLAKNISVSWYSRLNYAIEKKGSTQTGAQWLVWADARAKEGMIDKEEMYWTGLEDWLDEKKFEKITKPEILKFLEYNKVEIAEKVLGEKSVVKEGSSNSSIFNAAKLALSEEGIYAEVDMDGQSVMLTTDNTTEPIEDIENFMLLIDEVKDLSTKLLLGEGTEEEFENFRNAIKNLDILFDYRKMYNEVPSFMREFGANRAINRIAVMATKIQKALNDISNLPNFDTDEEVEQDEINPTRIQYTSPNLDNKKEIVLYADWKAGDNTNRKISIDFAEKLVSAIKKSIPEREHSGIPARWQFVDQIMDAYRDWTETDLFERLSTAIGYDEASKAYKIVFAGRKLKPVIPFKSNDEIHFGTVTGGRALVWLRFGDTFTEDGRKVMVIDEIQSQRHEAGRDKGYSSDLVYPGLHPNAIKISTEYRNQLTGQRSVEVFIDGELVVKKTGTYLSDEQIKNELISQRKSGGVPNAPFKKTYTDLAAKRALIYAVENGYDAVAWNTGEQVNQRFSLSNVADKITYSSKGYLYINTRNGEIKNMGLVSESELPNMIGKDLAKQLLALDADENGEKTIDSFDTEIGGEPMKKYYGSVKEGRIGDVGKAFEKYAKKYDKGVRVEPINDRNYMPDGTKGMFAEGMSIPITEGMKMGMQEFGMPLMQIETSLHTNISNLKKDAANYDAAKAGDIVAAKKVVDRVVKEDKIKNLPKDATVVPVISMESTVQNMLPLAYAAKISQVNGNKIDVGIVQSYKSYHTGASPATRLLRPVFFEGPVNPGEKYIIVDDVATSGATMSALTAHIKENGGIVEAISVLAQGRFAGLAQADPGIVKKLEDKFGKEKLTKFVEDYGLSDNTESLTQGQAARLLKYGSLNRIREKFFEDERARIFGETSSKPYQQYQKALEELKQEFDKAKQIGITPNQNDPTGLVLLAKAIKALYYGAKLGVTNLVELSKELGGNSIEWLRKAQIRLKNFAKLKPGSLAIKVFTPKTSTSFVKAVNAASLMNAQNIYEFRQNMAALSAATDDKELQKAFQALSDMATMDLKGAQQFVSEVSEKPSHQIVVDRNGVPHYVYNEKSSAEPLTLEHFSISSRVKKALNDIGVPVREKYIPRALGVYFVNQKIIGTRSLLEVFTAIHEGMHHIDFTSNITDKIMNSGNNALKEELKKIYQTYYAGAKATHPTRLQIIEGLAVLMNEYLGDPVKMHQDYPIAVDAVIKIGGTYNVPLINQLLAAMENIVMDASKVNPIYRTGLRLADMQDVIRKAARSKEHTWAPYTPSMLGGGSIGMKRYAALQVDTSAILEELDQLADTAYSDESVAKMHFLIQQAAQISQAWLNRNGGYIAIMQSNGNYKYDNVSVSDIVAELNRLAKSKGWDNEYARELFNQYLINRRAKGDYQRMVDAKNAYDLYMANFPDPDLMTDIQKTIASGLFEEFAKWRSIVNNDNFDMRDVNNAIAAFENTFKDATAIFDRINQNLLEFSRNTGLVSEKKYREWSKYKDYASFQRFFQDDLAGGNDYGQASMGQFKSRKGSAGATFLGSMEAMVLQIPKTIIKGYNNMFWMRFMDFVAKHGEDFGISQNQMNQEFIRVPKTGRIIDGKVDLTPLRNNPNYISFYINGSEQFYETSDWIRTMATTLSPESYNETILKIGFAATGLFGQMTTSANPFFAIPNLTVDQISSLINSKTGKVVPIASELFEVAKEWKALFRIAGLKMGDPKALENLEKYLALAGDKQTLSASWNKETTLGEIIERAMPKRTAKYKVLKTTKVALDILSAPVNLAEILTRFGEFNRALKMGMDESTALYLSAHVSAPFYKKGMYGGKYGRITVKLNSYWNASTVAVLKTLKSIKEDPIKVGAVTGALITISAISAASVFMGLGGDDEERKAAEKGIADMANRSLEEFGKYIFLWNGKNWISIRVLEPITSVTGPAQMFAFSTAYQMNLNKSMDYSLKDYFVPAEEGLPGAIKSVYGLGKSAITLDPNLAGATILQSLGNIIEPATSVAINRKTWPKLSPIVNMSMEKLDAKYQFDRYTSGLAKYIGEEFDVSPMKVDYFLKAQFGSNARFLLNQGSDSPRPLSSYIWRHAPDNLWQRGREFGLFMQQLQAIEKHKNSIPASLKAKGVDFAVLEQEFKDNHLTPADFVKTNNFKDFKRLYPEYAQEVKDTYNAYTQSKGMSELNDLVEDLANKNLISDNLKLQWFQTLYQFNRDLAGSKDAAKNFAMEVKKIKGIDKNEMGKINHALNKILASDKK